MDLDTSGDQQTRAHLMRLYAELSWPQRDAISEALRAADASDAQATPHTSSTTEPQADDSSAEALAARHLRVGQTQPAALARALRLPVAIIALGLAAPEDADWSKRRHHQ
jgi:hypothetical protein